MKSDVEKLSESVNPDALGSWFLRAALVLFFAFLAATAATMPMEGLKSRQFPVELVPHLQIPAWLLIGAVVVQSVLLGLRGKLSASWAVLAFGSLCAALITFLVAVVWYDSDIIGQRWGGILFLTVTAAALIRSGLRAAFRGRWGEMFLWSIPVLFLLVFCGVCINYAQYFYCQRNNIKFVPPTKQVPPAPAPTR
jgi:hypothetical protein